MFSFRNGDDNVAYSNFFFNSGGIRCKQANNIYCYNNYFQGSGTNQTAGLPGSGTAPVYLEYFGNGYGNNFNFFHNTFYGSTASIIQTPLTNCTWANNLFVQPIDSIFSGTSSGQTFVGNIYQGILGIAISSGMQNANPNLVLNNSGFYGIGSTSIARAASSANYPALFNLPGIDTLLTDIQGQQRPVSRTLRDVGCDQFASDSTINSPLTLADVGPDYLKPIQTGLQTLRSQSATVFVNAFPNPCTDQITFDNLPLGAVLRIVDLKGNEVACSLTSQQKVQIDLHHVGVGAYIYQVVHLNHTIAMGKLVKANY